MPKEIVLNFEEAKLASCTTSKPLMRTGESLDLMNDWLTANEAATYLKVHPRTLLLWARQGKVPAHRLSGVRRCIWRFLKCELDRMLGVSSADSAEGRLQ
jgi:excisionase family DNA binding protein